MLPALLRPGRLLSLPPLRPPAPRGAAAAGDPARSPGTTRGKEPRHPGETRGRGLGSGTERGWHARGTSARVVPSVILLAWVPTPAGEGEVESDPREHSLQAGSPETARR